MEAYDEDLREIYSARFRLLFTIGAVLVVLGSAALLCAIGGG